MVSERETNEPQPERAMTTKLKITGSAKGYSLTVVGKSLYARGSVAKRMDGSTGLTWDGTYLPSGADREKVEAVITEVMTTGVEQTITIGDRTETQAVAPAWKSGRGLTLTEEMDREDTDF